ncbi:MAG TPA: prolyl aminopeptidase [Stellaceae bacterium]|nr:prolyl aminopeptidase [Stellaceae bacterium]
MDIRELFPAIEPFRSKQLDVSALHRIYYEEVGNPEGVPILFLHGGPGGGLAPDHRRFFDPRHYRVVLIDQRGAGKSTPHAELRENTTWHLVDDIEAVREDCGIAKWIVFGGSWGSTLALAYAITHPEKVLGLILRGIFLCRKLEIDWFYQEGASHVFPDAWEDYLAPIPEGERGDLVAAYHRRLTGADEMERLRCAVAWSKWEASTMHLVPNDATIREHEDPRKALALARIECHYFANRIFFASDNFLLENIHRIRHLPGTIIHGRYDVVCPMRNAWDLHRAWPEAELVIVPDAGHTALEVGTRSRLLEATEAFKRVKAAG